ncbi:MAG: hypothetical protein R2836_01235 [Chitinophagales bacterium]
MDINKDVFDKNYKSSVNIEGDATTVLKAIWERIKDKDIKNGNENIATKIAELNKKYDDEWLVGKKDQYSFTGLVLKV